MPPDETHLGTRTKLLNSSNKENTKMQKREQLELALNNVFIFYTYKVYKDVIARVISESLFDNEWSSLLLITACIFYFKDVIKKFDFPIKMN